MELKDPPRPIESLPGAHRLRFQLPGQQPVEIGFSLEKGEKNHLVRLRLPASKASGAPAPAASPIPKRPVPASTYWLSAAAVVAFASSTAFLVSGLNEHADAREICAPTCDDDIRQSIQARLLLADISAGAGLVLGGLAVYTYLQRPMRDDQSSRLRSCVESERSRAFAPLARTVLMARRSLARPVLAAAWLCALSCSLVVDTSDVDEGCGPGRKLCAGECVKQNEKAYGCTPHWLRSVSADQCHSSLQKRNLRRRKLCLWLRLSRVDETAGCLINVLVDKENCGDCNTKCEDWRKL